MSSIKEGHDRSESERRSAEKQCDGSVVAPRTVTSVEMSELKLLLKRLQTNRVPVSVGKN